MFARYIHIFILIYKSRKQKCALPKKKKKRKQKCASDDKYLNA